ncbi:MAG TPA: Asp-tRNA(Asn)/Glu-tRNA(Gln) amidotransferase subunit GatB [bacterium]|nr:Asp-tRNA(Asn)/Glu-tRNA(Gln) amidotransferase subunit GatB [bacterium]
MEQKLLPIIGLEIHIELKTKSKMFCACSNQAEGAKANSLTCPICLGHPGTLPRVNEQAIEFALRLAQALNFKIDKKCGFARKNYFYPDLPKGYQITQSNTPIGYDGELNIDGQLVKITRVHLEEDTGKIFRDPKTSEVTVDYNRAGTPLIEMVTYPVINSATEASRFGQELQKILRYLDISDANMEKGEMRCEANISVQAEGSFEFFGPGLKAKNDFTLNNKVEVKNLNSFKALERAINYEIERQSQMIENGETVLAETRGWDEKKNETKAQRRKETMADYRYFDEPDLPKLDIGDEWLAKVEKDVAAVELPQAKADRWQKEAEWTKEQANLLNTFPVSAKYADDLIKIINSHWPDQKDEILKTAANWLANEVLKHSALNSLDKNPITPLHLAELSRAIVNNEITSTNGQVVLVEIVKDNSRSVVDIIKELDLGQMDNSEQLVNIAREVIAEFPQQAAEYRSGKTTLLQFFVGQLMRRSSGKANPQIAKEILEKELA